MPFLDALVAPSGGLSSTSARRRQSWLPFDQRLQGLGDTYARDVRLRLELPPALELLDGLRLTPFAQLLPFKSQNWPWGTSRAIQRSSFCWCWM